MAPKKKTDTVDCVVMRDYWDEEGARHPKGMVEAVSVDVALDGIEAGTLTRHKAD